MAKTPSVGAAIWGLCYQDFFPLPHANVVGKPGASWSLIPGWLGSTIQHAHMGILGRLSKRERN